MDLRPLKLNLRSFDRAPKTAAWQGYIMPCHAAKAATSADALVAETAVAGLGYEEVLK